jgi:hypothetical protein
MNVLERLVEEELTRVPPGPSAAALRHRASARRARRYGSVAVLAIVFAVLGIAAMLQSPGSHQVQVSQPAPTASTTTATVVPDSPLPLATKAEFPRLSKMAQTVLRVVENNIDPKAAAASPTSAEIVATTNARAYAHWGGSKDDKPTYIVQVAGKFVCKAASSKASASLTCPVPVGASAPRGGALQVRFDDDGFVLGFSPQPRDLSELGTVYRLELAPLATTERFPALANMVEIVRNNVRSDYRPISGSALPTTGEIVETTRGRAFSVFGGSLDNLDAHIYVVQVIGNFTCDGCSRPANAVAPHGRALRLLFDATGHGYGFGIGPAVDLSPLGTVYRVQLP